jgi:DNA-directed RNA polymerase specialized sigma24 family protein
MRHYHGYSNREIAASLGVPEQTVASRLAAARKQLQVTLSDTRQPRMVDPA